MGIVGCVCLGRVCLQLDRLRWEDLLPINTFQLRIAKLAFFIVLFLHLAACAQVCLEAAGLRIERQSCMFLFSPLTGGGWDHESGAVCQGTVDGGAGYC